MWFYTKKEFTLKIFVQCNSLKFLVISLSRLMTMLVYNFFFFFLKTFELFGAFWLIFPGMQSAKTIVLFLK